MRPTAAWKSLATGATSERAQNSTRLTHSSLSSTGMAAETSAKALAGDSSALWKALRTSFQIPARTIGSPSPAASGSAATVNSSGRHKPQVASRGSIITASSAATVTSVSGPDTVTLREPTGGRVGQSRP